MTLEVQNMSAGYNSSKILADVSFSIMPGELVALVGSNGAGKTTLLNVTAGLHRPDRGTVDLCGESLHAQPLPSRAAMLASLGSPTELKSGGLTAGQRIAQGLWPTRRAQVPPHDPRVRRAATELEIDNATLASPLRTLSTGQQKRVHLARALIHEQAKLFVFDEPFASLDGHNRQLFMNALRQRCDTGAMALVGLHHLDMLEQFNSVIGLANGKVRLTKMPTGELSKEKLWSTLYGSRERS